VDDFIFGLVLFNTTAGTLYKFSLNPFQSTPVYSLGSTLLGGGAILKPSKALAIIWTSSLNVIQLQGLVITKTNLTKRFVIDVSQTPKLFTLAWQNLKTITLLLFGVLPRN
jgi:hypothetical protein